MKIPLLTHSLGYPRVGALRQLKRALEAYWKGTVSEVALLQTAKGLRESHWNRQKAAKVDWIPSNDFSLYDHVLDATALVGAVPARFNWASGQVNLATYFAMARGTAGAPEHAEGTRPMELRKWFNTNYHYIVPEWDQDQIFFLASNKPIDEFKEALALGVKTKPVLLGPCSLLKLGKVVGTPFDRGSLLPSLVRIYARVLRGLAEAGAEWVQLDEPAFALDLTSVEHEQLRQTYAALAEAAPGLRLMVATYYNSLGLNLPAFARLPVHGFHVDAVNSADEIPALLSLLNREQVLSLGLVNSRNVWRNNYDESLALIRECTQALGVARVWLAPGSSLLHLPYSTRFEIKMNPEVKSWLCFAEEKLAELDELRSIYEGNESLLLANRALREAKANSPLRQQPLVRERLKKVEPADLTRKSSFEERKAAQRERLKLPPLPTTTIGSFPQTDELRALRSAVKENRVSQAEYESFVEKEIARVVRWQDELGLDVLVHGEFERSDMVEYFGQHLEGFVITENGWVQSNGPLCVRPPVIYGDVARTEPITLRWAKYAQSLSRKPVKGMLTGPMTILKWSFVREDMTLCDTAFQLALAIREEVADLEAAGISIIQIDEPALREALPLKARQREEYLLWSIDAFRFASSGVADTTQIHTHMCYCEFDDILPAVSRLDADVLSFESSRSGMARLPAFVSFRYPNEIGPGVHDVHSARVSSKEEIKALVTKALEIVPAERMWVNPDCGLKNMDWQEAGEALRNMVEATKELRENLAS